MRFLLLSLIVLGNLASLAQGSRFLLDGIDQNVLNPDLLSSKYEQIKGSPYLFEDFISADVFFFNGQQAENQLIRFDAYANTLQIKQEEIFEYSLQYVDSVVVDFPTTRVFIPLSDSGLKTIHERLYNGNIRFFSRVEINKIVSDNTQTGYSQSAQLDRFDDKLNYFIEIDGKRYQCKLNRKSISSVLEKDIDEYLKTSKNKLKSEEDVIQLLTYYNEII